MSADEEQEKVYEHLEKAQQADEPATKNYHIREALQILWITDETCYCVTDTTEESVD